MSQRVRGLSRESFRQIAPNGFGDGLNAYAHTMAWYRDRLFVGTTRANLCMIQQSNPVDLRCWPVDCPPDVYDLDRRAHIWTYTPDDARWTQVLVSPSTPGEDGKPLPRDIGYRGMTIFQGRSDPAPALYVCSWSPSRSRRPPVVLRSRDGEAFVPVSEPQHDPTLNTYRALLPFGGRLYTSPTGRTRGWEGTVHQGARENMSGAPVVFESNDPETAPWRPVSLPGFGNPDNTTIFEMAEFDGHLYAGTLNPHEGFELWKTRARGEAPYRWTRVLYRGAFRGPLNEAVVSMCAFDGALYLGTGIQNGGYDRTFKVGPGAAEVIRVFPDDSWELLVGTARDTPDGFKAPLSGLRAGFRNFFNGYVWRMAVHEGWLYAGTYNWSVMLPYMPLERWPDRVRELAEWHGVDRLVQRDGGFDLWRTRDGETWLPVTRDGFGNPYNYGVRTLVSTPGGLFVGTANPFGPRVAVRDRGRWHYVANPRGGLEVWLGAPGGGNGNGGDGDRPRREGAVVLGAGGRAPVRDRINRRYDTRMYDEMVDKFYGQSDFTNFGLRRRGTRTQAEACENLVEELLSFLPHRRGRILDVACGKGATTRQLLRDFVPEGVTAINISERQLATARRNAPGCTFLEMDATRLDFAPGSFDHVICVEAAFHFDTRAAFLREAWRVLRPGGTLVLSDILLKPGVERAHPYLVAANQVEDLEDYARLYADAGFERVRIGDATGPCWRAFARHCLAFARRERRAGRVDGRRVREVLAAVALGMGAIRHYVLVGARKPGHG